MKALIIGCGRVGTSVALELDAAGWDVVAIDEREEALSQLGDNWRGGFFVGHGMDVALLREAGIEDADAVVVSTDGDNSNIVIGQTAQKLFGKYARATGRCRPSGPPSNVHRFLARDHAAP